VADFLLLPLLVLSPFSQIRNEISVLKSISQGHTNIVTLWGALLSSSRHLRFLLLTLPFDRLLRGSYR
jgi:hypothetical protein